MKTLRGFTLIELLTVMAILAISTALLLPSLTKSKTAAQSTACKNNLRQIGLALNLYAGETGYYPAAEHLDLNINRFVTYGWMAQLLTHVSSSGLIFKCPATTAIFAWPTNRSRLGYLFPYNVDKQVPFSYGYNGWGVASTGGLGLGIDPATALPAAKVIQPADMIAIGDSDGDGGSDGEITFHRFGSLPVKPPGIRHRTGANVVFCDGHVEWQKQNRWIELTESAARRWNNDQQPHRNLWISASSK